MPPELTAKKLELFQEQVDTIIGNIGLSDFLRLVAISFTNHETINIRSVFDDKQKAESKSKFFLALAEIFE